jgi:penicillin-binding protein 1A
MTDNRPPHSGSGRPPRSRTSSEGRRVVPPSGGAARRRTPRAGGATRPRRTAPRRRTRWTPVIRISLLVLLLAAIAGGVSGCVALGKISQGLPDPTKPLTGTDQTTQVLDRNGKQITGLFADQNRQYVTLKDIPLVLRHAVIATEDQRYYQHAGVDPIGMLRALWIDIRAGAQVQGGSTITQQYVKQAFVGDERSLKRKVQEALLAYRLEQAYSKDKILEMYLNTIYFGHGAYGVQTAAKVYFGKSVQQLSVAEAAMLAGVIKSPAGYSPYLQPVAAKGRRDTVLGQMRDQGYIDAATYAAAVASPIKTAGLKGDSRIAPYFVAYLKEQLVKTYGEDVVYRGGLKVTTTLDLKTQAAAEKAVRDVLPNKTDPSAALVALDPKTGEILAMVGGRDFQTQQFNVATQGHRQSGSSFKPFVLATALQQGISPEQTFNASSAKLQIPGGQTWSVAGESGFSGPMRLREATWYSINPVFAQLVLKVGADNVVKTARAMGITTTITPVPAVALGGMAEGVTPLEMADAYATFANGGSHLPAIGILQVTDSTGKVLYSAKPVGTPAIDPAIAYLTTDILKGVIQHGTATAADIGRPAAGKTGTTQSNADAWFVGYTPQLVASVWMGYADAARPMTSVHGITVYGGSFPAKIWAAFMKAALANTPPTQFKQPPGLTTVPICLDSGGKATQWCPHVGTGLFLTDHLPADCTLHKRAQTFVMPNLVGMARVDAVAALGKLALHYVIVQKDVAGAVPGTVSAQDPKSGSSVTTATPVTLTVATGTSPAKPPVAAFSWLPATPAAGATVHFDASTSSGAITTWTWNFGDGSAKDQTSGQVATHVFVANKNGYDVTLAITNQAGITVSTTKHVTIR